MNLKTFGNENRRLNEKVKVGMKTYIDEDLQDVKNVTELKNFEKENAKLNSKENAKAKMKENDQIIKLKQLEGESEMNDPEYDRKKEREKRTQTRRQVYLEQLDS